MEEVTHLLLPHSYRSLSLNMAGWQKRQGYHLTILELQLSTPDRKHISGSGHTILYSNWQIQLHMRAVKAHKKDILIAAWADRTQT